MTHLVRLGLHGYKSCGHGGELAFHGLIESAKVVPAADSNIYEPNQDLLRRKRLHQAEWMQRCRRPVAIPKFRCPSSYCVPIINLRLTI